jgi:biopolymer transport protein ExbD
MGLKKRAKVNAEFNMSSLTDIIFLLLIFFMLTSSLVTPNAINLAIPGNSTPKKKVTRKDNVTIKVLGDDRFIVARQKSDFEGIEAILKTVLAEDLADTEIDGPPIVILEISEHSEAQEMVNVLSVIANVGAKATLASSSISIENGKATKTK